MRLLSYQLCGPTAAWGTEGAVGSVRPTWGEPSFSALLGMIAAARGLPRNDASALEALTRGLRFAMRIDVSGEVFTDFHTFQTASTPHAKKVAKLVRHPTRPDVLRHAQGLQTGVTERGYVADFAAWIAVYRLDDGGEVPSLAEIADALRGPRWPIYLGRRACPPSAPLDPRIVEVDDVEAFARTDTRTDLAAYRSLMARPRWPRTAPAHRRLLWQPGFPLPTGASTTFQRRGLPTTRTAWQFASSLVHSLALED